MREGLAVVQVTGAYYGYAVTRVGWLRRVAGDEYELHGAVTATRTGRAPEGLDDLAAGKMERYELSQRATQPEMIHRLLMRRALAADERAWAKVCPKPEGWSATDDQSGGVR